MDTVDMLKIYQRELIKVAETLPLDVIAQVADKVVEAYFSKNTLYVCGNGGNAAYADNLAVDLSHHPFLGEDKENSIGNMKRFKVINLSGSPATISGQANDRGFEEVYAAQLEGMVEEKDIVLGFTGSGNSKNILRAFEVANKEGATSICISRGTGGKAIKIADYTVIVPPEEVGESQFPGMMGKNNYNFLYEDLGLSGVAHMITGILWKRVREKGSE